MKRDNHTKIYPGPPYVDSTWIIIRVHPALTITQSTKVHSYTRESIYLLTTLENHSNSWTYQIYQPRQANRDSSTWWFFKKIQTSLLWIWTRWWTMCQASRNFLFDLKVLSTLLIVFMTIFMFKELISTLYTC